MIIVPAIDIRGGKVVRLKRGRLREETIYGTDPVQAARRWQSEGARRLHIVDLDAVIEEKPQVDVVGAVIEAVRIPVEVGGGLRALEDAMRYKNRGADRVVFGTAAVSRPGVVQEAVRLWPESVVVAIEARDGKVALAGWNEVTTVSVLELAAKVKAWGVPRIEYTHLVRNGALLGPDLVATGELGRAVALRITAAGGISKLEDLRDLARLEPLGVDEVVVGKALYDCKFSLAEAQAAVDSPPEAPAG